ncbi:MAG: HD domain-containing protein [Desulfobacteraceae bacterium]|nr:MAG: HD domain-containing protein [Desulfobacteraceae bacterium]
MMSDVLAKQKRIVAVAAYLNAAVSNARLYSTDHPQVARALERAQAELAHVLRLRSEITFMVVDQDLVVDNRPVVSQTPHVSQFIQTLMRSGIERLTFTAGFALAELTQLVGGMADDNAGVRSTTGIKLGKVQVRVVQPVIESAALSPEMRERIEQVGLTRDLSLEQLKALYQHFKTARSLPEAAGVEQMVRSFINVIGTNVHPLHVLATLKSSDEYTFTHAINVCILTMAQAQSLDIGGRKLQDIGIAAALHDAGKMFVPDDILNKPGSLSDEEWVYMRSHTIRGARQILRMEGLPRLAFIGALEHHIRFDGTGYPALGHRRPNMVSQMIAIADNFDAMRTRRPYKEPKPDALVAEILRKESGTALNPLLVENFLRLIKI